MTLKRLLFFYFSVFYFSFFSYCNALHAGASLMSKVAAAHGGEDHSKASSFMTDTLDKASRLCYTPISSSLCQSVRLMGLSCLPWTTNVLRNLKSLPFALLRGF